MKLKILVFLVIIALASWYVLIFQQSVIEPAPDTTPIKQTLPTDQVEVVDYEASFIIFTNGTLRTFSTAMYHQRSEDVFLTAANPNLIQVKKEGVTWQEFFDTLPLKLTKDCLTTGTGQTFCSNDNQSLKFYLNGEFEPHLLEKVIAPGDQLLISFGDESQAEIAEQLQLVPYAF
ncbi:MAG TPA: hypothetical protein VGA89_02050 [Patescibacteria group bacterium]|jgi:hypothetical protein